jgi:hypothetical protein
MEDVIVERRLPAVFTEDRVLASVDDSSGCLGLHAVEWQESFLSIDGRSMICRMQAHDAESVRVALRQASSPFEVAWNGTIHAAVMQTGPTGRAGHGGAAQEGAPRPAEVNVVVERSFVEPVALGDIQAMGRAEASCLEAHNAEYLRTFFSRDGRRMICLYSAPDAEAVRIAQRQARMPVDRVWGCRWIRPGSGRAFGDSSS